MKFMICLFCGAENEYGTGECKGCKKPFKVFPPYIKANHVSQLQAAIKNYLEGEIERDDLYNQVRTFENLFYDFEDKWKLDEKPAAKRLGESLSDKFTEPMEEIDKGYKHLLSAMELLFDAEDGETQQSEERKLGAAYEELVQFFGLTSSSCGWMIREMETMDKKDLDVGAIFNLKDE
jgi:hypothetical protein